jgi:hypothetical protein
MPPFAKGGAWGAYIPVILFCPKAGRCAGKNFRAAPYEMTYSKLPFLLYTLIKVKTIGHQKI